MSDAAIYTRRSQAPHVGRGEGGTSRPAPLRHCGRRALQRALQDSRGGWAKSLSWPPPLLRAPCDHLPTIYVARVANARDHPDEQRALTDQSDPSPPPSYTYTPGRSGLGAHFPTCLAAAPPCTYLGSAPARVRATWQQSLSATASSCAATSPLRGAAPEGASISQLAGAEPVQVCLR